MRAVEDADAVAAPPGIVIYNDVPLTVPRLCAARLTGCRAGKSARSSRAPRRSLRPTRPGRPRILRTASWPPVIWATSTTTGDCSSSAAMTRWSCRAGKLANYKAPRDIVFLDELPRNAVGKVLRKELRAHTAGT